MIIKNSVLVTGATGFVGSWLCEYLLDKKLEVHGLKRWRSPMENINHIKNKLKLHDADLRDAVGVNKVIKEVRPNYVFHIAAQSFVPYSFDNPHETITTNINGTINLLESIKENNLNPRIVVTTSSEVYGQVTKKDLPITEDCPFRPQSPYGVSKAGEDLIAYQYHCSYGMDITRVRLFTHSVSKWTPVIIKDSKSNLIDISYISEIRQKQKRGGYLSGKLLQDETQIWDLSFHNLEVWNDGRWTKLKHISCHPINNHKLLEVSSRGGVVDVTDNHSVINEKGEEVNACDLKIGDKLKLTALPNVELTQVPTELAWLYGFFAAEGCVTGGRMNIDNKDRTLLDRSKQILLKYLAIDSHIGTADKDGVFRLHIRKPFKIAKIFYREFYAVNKNKKIPKIILNANRNTKLFFLDGYNCGDGDRNNLVKSKYYRFKTNSQILAMGICLLIQTVLNVKYRIHVEHTDGRRYFEIRCLNQNGTANGNHLLKDDNSITSIIPIEYGEEVWDFETENHWFNAGIGGCIVHNSGPRRGDVFFESSFAKQIAMIEAGIQKPIIQVGNLSSIRTLLDIRDAVEAYWLLVKKCPPGEVYNIGGDANMPVGDYLKKLIEMSPMKDKIRIKVDKNLLRPSDVTLQIPSSEKFRKATGWKPKYTYEDTLKSLLDYWRGKIK